MFVITSELVSKIDSIIGRGLSAGIGVPGQQVCIEAAICEALGMPHGDDPKCVSAAVRAFKIRLNDGQWSTPEARAKGMRDLGIAQLGSLGVVDDTEFTKRVAEKVIRKLIPALFREVVFSDAACLAMASRCENEGTGAAANAAANAAYAATNAAYAAANAASAANAAYAAANAASAANAAYAATNAAYAAATNAAYAAATNAAYADTNADTNAANAANAAGDKYLSMGADLAFEVLKELNSPGVAWV